MPYNIQFTTNTPKAFSEAGVSDVLSGSERLFEADHWIWDSEKTPNWRLWKFVKDRISSMNEDKNAHIANYSSYELKRMVGVFVQSLGLVDGL